MNQYEYYRDIQLSGGTCLTTAVSGLTDATITTPGSEYDFFNQVELDSEGRLKIYIRDYISPTPTPSITPTPTPTPTPVPPDSFEWILSIENSPICEITGTTYTVYTANYELGSGYLFLDSNLTTPFPGQITKYYVIGEQDSEPWGCFTLDSNGQFTGLETNCIPYTYQLRPGAPTAIEACSVTDPVVTIYSFSPSPTVGNQLLFGVSSTILPLPSSNQWFKLVSTSEALLVDSDGIILDSEPC